MTKPDANPMLAAVTRLGDALAAENAALAALDMPAAAALLPAKRAALEAMAAARPGAAATPALRQAARRTQDLADENRRLLECSIKVQTRVLAVLAGAARAANPAPRYGRLGAYAARPTTGWALSARA